MHVPHFEIPKLRVMARHALPNVVEGTLIPVVLFLATLHLLGVWGAVIVGTIWGYGAILRRVVTRRRIPGILALGVLTLTARTIITLATGSVFVYFLQPTLGTALVATAFLVSLPVGRPLCQRLAGDFCPIPDEVMANHHVRLFFKRITLLWAVTQFLNAGLTLWLLVSQSVATFVVARAGVSWGLTGGAILISTVWFKRSMTRHGILRPRQMALAA